VKRFASELNVTWDFTSAKENVNIEKCLRAFVSVILDRKLGASAPKLASAPSPAPAPVSASAAGSQAAQGEKTISPRTAPSKSNLYDKNGDGKKDDKCCALM